MCIVVLIDARSNNGSVLAMTSSREVDETIYQFEDMEEVRKCHIKHPLNGFEWMAVNMDTGELAYL